MYVVISGIVRPIIVQFTENRHSVRCTTNKSTERECKPITDHDGCTSNPRPHPAAKREHHRRHLERRGFMSQEALELKTN